MMHYGNLARKRLTEPWEESVLFVYDDKRPKTRIGGRLQYPEWDGGAVRGTLTIGFGHTDAAGPMQIRGQSFKITQGLRITQEEAEQILSDDLAPVERLVNSKIKAQWTQHQYEAMVDTTFNCPSALNHCATLLNAGRANEVPSVLLQYTRSRGEFMQGLVNRRNAEIRWFNTPDDPESAEVQEVFSPKAERAPVPSIMSSKTASGAAIVSVGGALDVMQQVNDVAVQVQQTKDNTQALGIGDMIAPVLSNPRAIIAIFVVVAAVWIFYDRWSKRQEHLI